MILTPSFVASLVIAYHLPANPLVVLCTIKTSLALSSGMVTQHPYRTLYCEYPLNCWQYRLHRNSLYR